MELLFSVIVLLIALIPTLFALRFYRALLVSRQDFHSLQLQQADFEKQLKHVHQLEHAQKAQLKDSIAQLQSIQGQLTETQDYLTSIINSMPSILVGVTGNGVITHWNASATVNTQRLPADVLGKHLEELADLLTVTTAQVQHCIHTGKTQRTRQTITEGGEKRYRDITLYPLQASKSNGQQEAIIRIDDVSEQVHMESTLLQNSKLVALGEMSMNLVHELNNPVSAVLQNAQMLRRRIETLIAQQPEVGDSRRPELMKLLAHLDEAGMRSHHLIQNLLRFARSEPYESRPVNVNQLLKSSIDICELNEPNAHVGSHLTPADPCVQGNESELQQVLVNLIQNAFQAVQQAHPQFGSEPAKTTNGATGVVTVSSDIQLDQVVIEVKDNGPGIPQQHLDKIFTPFFTTKPSGKGTGLGLSISHQIITKHHQGRLAVSSTPGQGTCFTITLPLLADTQKSVKSPQVDYA